MQKTVLNLLLVQLKITVFLLVLTWPSPYRHLVYSIFFGALTSVLTTGSILLVVRRLPKILKAKMFYAVMWLCEIMKWLIVIVLVTVFLRMRIDALGLVIGFVPTYLGGYFMMLKLK